MLYLIEKSSISETNKLFLQLIIPWISAAIGLFAPIVSAIVIAQSRYYGVKFFLWRAKRHLRSLDKNVEHNAKVIENSQSNIAELEQILAEMNVQGGRSMFRLSVD